MGDAHRAHNLRRQIAIRLPLPGAYPGPFPLNDGDFVLGRDAELRELVDLAAPVLWLGAPGSGLTTLLRAASRAARARSWAVVDLPLNFGPGGARDALTTALRTQAGADLEPTTSVTDSLHRWLRGSGYEGLLLTIDGVDRLPGAAGEEILQLFRGVQRHGEFPVRALATALPTFSGADHRLVSPYLPADAARELVEEVTDFLGISFDPFSAADRLIYYSGRHVALLHQLLWGLVEVLGDREPGTFLVAGPDEVDRAARSGGFRIELDRTLELITPHPELRAALAALVLEEEARGSAADTSAESLHEWVHGARPTLGVAELRRAATQLEALGLAVRLTSGWRLPPGGVPHLISDRIGNAEDFLDQAITDWNTRSAPREAGDARPQ
jgi:Fe2+ or Zn2+ uptake regulation protein